MCIRDRVIELKMLIIAEESFHNFILGTIFELLLIRRYNGLHAQAFRVSMRELGLVFIWGGNLTVHPDL